MPKQTQPVRFDPAPWFDQLTEYMRYRRPPAKLLWSAVTGVPTRRNLTKFRDLAVVVMPVRLGRRMLASVDAILEGAPETKETYRYLFWNSCDRHVVSATGELFSLVRQALTYYEEV